MKKLLIIVALIFTYQIANAQISKVDKTKHETIGEIKGQMELSKSENDVYIFSYKDQNFQHLNEWKSFAFYDEDGALNTLKETILEIIKTKNKEGVRLDLPESTLDIKFNRISGIKAAYLHHNDKSTGTTGMTFFSKASVKKIFP